MKNIRNIVFYICLLFVVTINAQGVNSLPTVSSSKVTFVSCVPTEDTISLTLFPGDQWQGRTFSQSGTYVEMIKNARGCDSIVTLNVRVLNGAVRGKFAVSATDTVYFSQGNLQYCAAPNAGINTHNTAMGIMQGIWRFAPNQFSYIGIANENVSAAYSGWIDMFAWGTSGYHDAAEYQPYAISQVIGDYSNNSITGTLSDWGVFNAISNGGNEPGLWFTLTKSQWTYLYSGRNNASDLRGAGTVNGITGYLFLPDNYWDNPQTVPFSKDGKSFSSNIFTGERWSQLENLGAVFLPMTYGYRIGQSMNNTTYSYYWAADQPNTSVGYIFYFYPSSSNIAVSTGSNTYKNRGLSVRLVQKAN